jgi:hypothetical protein
MDTTVTLLNNLTVLASSLESLYLKLTLCSNNHPLHVKIAFSRSSCLPLFCHVKFFSLAQGHCQHICGSIGALGIETAAPCFRKIFWFHAVSISWWPPAHWGELAGVGRSRDWEIGSGSSSIESKEIRAYIYISIYLFIYIYIYLFIFIDLCIYWFI